MKNWQTSGFQNAANAAMTEYTPDLNNQGNFIKPGGVIDPLDSGKKAGKLTDFAANTEQKVLTGGVASTAPNPQRPTLAQTGVATVQQNAGQRPVTQEERQPADLPNARLTPIQIDRSTYITNRLIQEGFTSEQAAGIVGNLIQESQLNHKAVHPRGGTFGIAQWRGARIREYERLYGSINNSTFENQVDYLIWELRNTEKRAARAIRNAKTIEESSDATRRFYERPGEHEAHDEKRRKYSNDAHQVFTHGSRRKQ